MKCLCSCALVLLFFALPAAAVDFSPKVMKITAPEIVNYDFDGSALSIPITISGTPALGQFLVFTKDKAQTTGTVRNGFMGWHTVNKIDTCVYVSSPTVFIQGSNTISWNGKDSDGALVPSGEYTYYIWGYDNVSTRTLMTYQINIHAWVRHTILTHSEDGKPLAHPIIFANDARISEKTSDNAPHKNKKWIVGGDPLDATLVETCISLDGIEIGGLYFHPDDHNYFFKCSLSIEGGLKKTKKWQWIPNGDAILQADWGDDGLFQYSGAWPIGWDFGPGVSGDGEDTLFLVNADISGVGTESELLYVDINDGTELKRFDLSKWWVDLDDGIKGGQQCGGPTDLIYRHDVLSMNSHSSCMHMTMNPHYEDELDALVWANDHGDYIGDKNTEVDAARPWVCNDYNSCVMPYNHKTDDNLFYIFASVWTLGGSSIGMLAPDGTGLGYFAFADQASAYDYGISMIDYGSPYDGLYSSYRSGSAEVTNKLAWHFIGYDSIKGILTSNPIAVEEAPGAFAVSQNSPNPFNPTTTISFSIPESGAVSIDVFNVAGQKVATVANGFMTAGKHSVTWDASGLSAGVYFYTVKAGEFVKTMKMTLLK